MATTKCTKNELKTQKQTLNQLERYLPTLQLKKALLQSEISANKMQKEQAEKLYQQTLHRLEQASKLFELIPSFPIEEVLKDTKEEISFENIAGVELPVLKAVLFRPYPIDFFDTPPWLDGLLLLLKKTKEHSIAVLVAKQRLTILEKELKEVATRVNLFEKVLIPRCKENIKKIRIFLGDLHLTAVSQAKVAKNKILMRQQHAY